MISFRDKVVAHIIASGLETEQKMQFIGFIQHVGDDKLKTFDDLFNKDARAVKEIYENVKAKYDAARGQNPNALQEILDQEKQFLTAKPE